MTFIVDDNLKVNAIIAASSNSIGTDGQVLASNGSVIYWTDTAGDVPGANGQILFHYNEQLQANTTLYWHYANNTLEISGNVVVSNVTTFNSNKYLLLPRGTTGERDGSPVRGQFRYNTTLENIEWYNGSSWQQAGTSAGEENQFAYSNLSGDSGSAAADAKLDTITFTGANGITTTVSDVTDDDTVTIVAVGANGVLVTTDGINVVTGNTQLVSNTSGLWLNAGAVKISEFDNDANFSSTVGTVTSIGINSGNLIDVSDSPVTGSGNITVDVDLSKLTTSTSDADGDFFAVVDASNVQRKLTKANINLSGFNNDANFSSTVGTVTEVTGGNGLTGSITSSGSLSVGAGDGITVNADDIAVNGANGILVTTDGVNVQTGNTQLVANTTGLWLDQSKITVTESQISDLQSYLTSYTETDPVVAAINGIVKSNGSTISAASAGTDYLTDVSQDITPQLGGNLDAQNNNITNLGTINTHTIPGGTGTFALTSDLTGGTVTEVTGGNGLTVTNGTTTPDLDIGQANGIIVDANSIQVKGANGILVTTNGVNVLTGNTQLVSNTTGLWLNAGAVNISEFVNDANFSSTVGTVTEVTGGNGLTVTNGTTTPDLDIGQGNGIFVTADNINVQVGNNQLIANTTGLWVNNAAITDLSRSSISVTDSGGDGSLTYTESTGVITYTGPSAAEVREHFGEGEGINIDDGLISGEDATTANKGIASFDSNHFTIASGAVSIATDSIDDTLIDFGTGANQVNTDDLPEGSTNLYYTNARVDSHLSGTSGVNYSSGNITAVGANGILITTDGINVKPGDSLLIANTTGLFIDNTGVDSGLNADLLDGQEGSYYLNTFTNFGGDVSGTYNNIQVTDDSHNHIIDNVDGLQSALNLKAPLASPALTGTATAVNLTISGDLTVNGTTSTINSDNINVANNLIELNSGLTGANPNDTGIIIERGSSGDNAFIGWDESADQFILGTTTATGDSTGNLTVTSGTIQADITGTAADADALGGTAATDYLKNTDGANGIVIINNGINVQTGNTQLVANTTGLWLNAGAVNISEFVNDVNFSSTVGTVTSIGITAGNLIDVSGSPITDSGNITVDVDLSELTTSTSDADGDFFAVVDASNVQRKLTKANINLSGFNNDANFVDYTSTPLDNQIAVFTDTNTIEGDANFTWNGTVLDVTGQFNIDNVRIDGNVLSTTNTDGDLTITPDGKGYIQFSGNTIILPTGITANRPQNAGDGQLSGALRFNTTDNIIEWYNGSGWIQPGEAGGQPNQNAYGNLSGDSGTATADSDTDEIIFTGGNGISTTVSDTGGNDTVTIDADVANGILVTTDGINVKPGDSLLIANTTGLFIDNTGAGSGLNADLLDGQEGSYYLNTFTSFGGDVSGTYNSLTIDNDAVTYAKMQNVSATNRILGRKTAGAGDTEELTDANVRTIINVEDGATADQTTEEIQDAAWGGTTLSGTQTGITVTYEDSTNDVDFVTEVTLAGSETLTNKTIDGNNNTLSNLDIGNEVDWAAATDVADRTDFAAGDKLLIHEDGVGLRKIDYNDLPGAGGALTATNGAADRVAVFSSADNVNGDANFIWLDQRLTVTGNTSVSYLELTNGIVANGSLGTTDQVLTANSTGGTFWKVAAGGSDQINIDGGRADSDFSVDPAIIIDGGTAV